jgi:ATP-dependent DNA ligase
VLPPVLPQLVANDGPRALRQAILDPDRFACEPKVDGVRGLVIYGPEHRGLPWQERRERLELLARAFDVPLELSPTVEPSVGLVEAMTDGRLEGIVLKDRTSTYRGGSRAGWTKIKDRSWYEREAWRFDRR